MLSLWYSVDAVMGQNCNCLSTRLDPEECSTLWSTLPQPLLSVWETNWKVERLLGQTACSHAGVPLLLPSSPSFMPAARSCTTTIKKKSSFLPSQSTNLVTTMILAAAAAATTAFVTSQRTDGGCSLLSLQFTNSSLSRFQV